MQTLVKICYGNSMQKIPWLCEFHILGIFFIWKQNEISSRDITCSKKKKKGKEKENSMSS